MRFLRGVMLSLLLLIALTVASNRLLTGLWNLGENPVIVRLLGWMPDWIYPLQKPLNGRLWAAGILALLAVYWALCMAIWWRRPRPMRVRTLSGGTMLVNPGAVIKFVKMQIDGHPAVISSRVRVRQTGSSNLAVGASIDIQPIESLPVIDEQIKAAVRNGLSQVMGIEKIDEITLLLDIDQKNIALKPGPATEPEPEPPPPPRAPLYDDSKPEPAPDLAPPIEPAHEIHLDEPARDAFDSAPEPALEPPPESQLTDEERLREREKMFPGFDLAPAEPKPEDKNP